MPNTLFTTNDLVENPTSRVPVCLCLDTSGSMNDSNAINELNDAIRLFCTSILEDEVARYSAEISIVTFGDQARLMQDFITIDESVAIPILKAEGLTPMGEAVNIALDIMEERKKAYKNAGVDYFQPWLVLMTDGKPNGSQDELERARARTVNLVNSKKLTVFPIGIGDDADMKTLKEFSPKRQPLKLKGLKFREFFEWLSKSVSSTSGSIPGEIVPLNNDFSDWATL